jgi:hypothetical protein
MKREYVLWHLREAAEAMAVTLKEIESDPDYDQGELEHALRHVYHHLNTAWNARDVSQDRIDACSEEDWLAWRTFPADIEMDI